MSEAEWLRIKQIFNHALDLAGADQSAYLDKACRDDIAIRSEVASLLDASRQANGFIDAPALFSLTDDMPLRRRFEQQLGHYSIEREVGSGGMGSVFLAHRADGQFDQSVALKVIRQTIADTHTIDRFKRERQILAGLNHPNIARLLDGGVSSVGEPFLVMEFVDGTVITEYVRAAGLKTDEILKLFVKVCAAVAYAHRNLVIHRDIKPGNILVTADGEPKLLDFGLAQLLEEHALSGATRTETAFRALTPAYASPEQLRGEPMDTTSDVFSLGVLLYELLTGSRPTATEGKSVDELISTLVRSPITPPSQAARGQSGLKGDIDTIVLRAMEPEATRRYVSVDQFATDIERHLSGLPIVARPNTYTYKVQKFIARHRAGAVAALLIFVAMAAGLAFGTRQQRIAAKEREKAVAVNAFLEDMLSFSDNSSGLSLSDGHETTVKDVLNAASDKLEAGELSGQPEIKAELERVVGSCYLSQGNYQLAQQHLQTALDIEIGLFGKDSAETLPTLVELGELYVAQLDFDRASAIYNDRLSILRAGVSNNTIKPDYLVVVLDDFAVMKRAEGDSRSAELLLREAISYAPRISPQGKVALGTARSVLALTCLDQGRFDEAEAIVRARLEEIPKGSDAETADLAANLNVLGSALMEKGEYGDAIQTLQEAESIYRKLYTVAFTATGDNLRIQAQTYYGSNDLAAAESKIDEAIAIYDKTTTSRYINYPTALAIRGLVLDKERRSTDAEPILRRGLELRAASFKPDHFLYAFSEGALGECLMDEGKFAEAEPLLTESLESLTHSQGEDNPRTVAARSRLEQLYSKWKRPAGAV